MVTQPPEQLSTVEQLNLAISRLERSVSELDADRQRLIRARRRNILFVGVMLSILTHIGIMVYLNFVKREVTPGVAEQPIAIEFAVLNETELTELTELELEDPLPVEVPEIQDFALDSAALDLEVDAPSTALEIDSSGAVPSLGGSGRGGGGDGRLSQGAAGTTFFGISSRGTRFAYIVDISGSMGSNNRIGYAMNELSNSIAELPDYAYFYIALYSSSITVPPGQRGWMRAKTSSVRAVQRWLRTLVANGGTYPMPGFDAVFDLPVRPDVIFFMTDGEIPRSTADDVADLNRSGGKVVINTIAFGSNESQEQLERIADESGGQYRWIEVR